MILVLTEQGLRGNWAAPFLEVSRVAKPEWGTKHTCEKCGARFYDLKRAPAVCPTCGTEWTPPKVVRQKREAPPPAAVEAPRPKPVVEAPAEAADTPEDEVDDDDEDVVEDEDADIAEGETDDVAGTFPEPKE